jgi:hypothetical protein
MSKAGKTPDGKQAVRDDRVASLLAAHHEDARATIETRLLAAESRR